MKRVNHASQSEPRLLIPADPRSVSGAQWGNSDTSQDGLSQQFQEFAFITKKGRVPLYGKGRHLRR